MCEATDNLYYIQCLDPIGVDLCTIDGVSLVASYIRAIFQYPPSNLSG
jgi:hypothetical protein